MTWAPNATTCTRLGERFLELALACAFQISLIAKGQAEKEDVVQHSLAAFKAKFMFFTSHIARMDTLFDASFASLGSTGELRGSVDSAARAHGGYMLLPATQWSPNGAQSAWVERPQSASTCKMSSRVGS